MTKCHISDATLNRAAFVSLPLVGICLVLFCTQNAIGISPDSTQYICAARNFVTGNGLVIFKDGQLLPLTHWPPLFPISLALLNSMGLDPLDGARWLNAGLLGVSLLMFSLILYQGTNGSVALAFLGTTVFLFTKEILSIYCHAWSDPLFFFFCLATLYLLAKYLITDSRRYLAASALAAGLGFLTRYAGVGVVITATLCLLLVQKKSYFLRLKDILTFGFISCIPMAVWVLRNMFIAGGASNFTIAFYPLSIRDLSSLPAKKIILILGLLLVLLMINCFYKRQKETAPLSFGVHYCLKNPFLFVFALFPLVYLGTLLVIKSFVYPGVLINFRKFTPVYLSLIIVNICLLKEVLECVDIKPLAKRVLLVVFSILVALTMYRGVTWAWEYSKDAHGYLSKEWREADLIAWIKGLPPDLEIYSNNPHGLYILSGRYTRDIPKKIDPYTMRANPDYNLQLARIKENLQERRAILIWISDQRVWVFPPIEKLQEVLELSWEKRFDLGTVFGVKKNQKIADVIKIE